MMRNNVKLLLLGLVLLMSQCVIAAEQLGPTIGVVTPNLIGRTLDGKLYSLRGDTGSVKVVNFFWIDCPPCREEMPILAKMEKDYPGVKFISVHTKPEFQPIIEQFIKDLSGAPSFVVVPTVSLRNVFKYRGLPHTMVLDRNNIVLANIAGYSDQNRQVLEKLLNTFSK